MNTQESRDRKALRALMEHPSAFLGDHVYAIRERECKGWDGPQVIAWSAAVTEAKKALAQPDPCAALADALRRFDGAPCEYDALNPCFSGRPTDVVGKHWGGGAACATCHARAALAAYEAGQS